MRGTAATYLGAAAGDGVDRADTPFDLSERSFGPGVVVGLEDMAQGPDRSGNVRWCIDDRGRFFSAHNRYLWVSADRPGGSDSRLHWNTALPRNPQRRLSASDLERVVTFVDGLDLQAMAANSPYGSLDGVSEGSVLRWTLTGSTGPTAVLVAVPAAQPEDLRRLADLVDALVAASPPT